MEQDGRLETSPRSAALRSTNAHEEGGTVLMTLFIASAEGTILRHATVPFPESYEAACQQALKSFAVYIPNETETVSLRRAYKKLDGEVVWTFVHEDDWSTVLKWTGEEIGVFIPDEEPDEIPYGKPPAKLVLFRLHHPEGFQILRAVSSFKECEAAAKTILWASGGRDPPQLMYDLRMIGSPERQAAYRSARDTSSIQKNAEWELLYSRELYMVLVNMFPEPLIINIM